MYYILRGLVRDDLKVPDGSGEVPKSKRKGLAVRYPPMKSSLYLTDKSRSHPQQGSH